MFDFIPIELYTPIYYYAIFFVVLLTFLHTQILTLDASRTKRYNKILGALVLIFVLFYMGLRPISGVFTDMTVYARRFEVFTDGGEIITNKDVFFNLFMKYSSRIMSIETFFFACASMYVVPCYLISKKWFKQYWFYAFLMLVSSFSFWSYGVNGIRNGIATSFFLIAISRDKRWVQILWLILAVNFHATMFLPTAALIISWYYNRPRGYYFFWLISIPLSLTFPGLWESLFATLIDDDRASYLTDEADNTKFSSVGFRWDFLLYSATGVFAGTYYLFKKKIKDINYTRLFNIYLFANAFWILVIRANFSNRFAYLSWFLLALVIIYPWLKIDFESKQHQKIGLIILAYFAFTFILNVILIT